MVDTRAARALRGLLVIPALLGSTIGVLTGAPAEAAVLCARPRVDGTFSATPKIREACRPNEVRIGILQLDPLVVGVQGTSTTTTTGTPGTTSPTSTSTSSPTPTVTTTTTPGPPVCGNGIVEAGETCDCSGTLEHCQPFPSNPFPYDWNACPPTPDERFQYCLQDCSACVPAPVCGDGTFDPGDTCDYAFGVQGDQCTGGRRCSFSPPCVCLP